MNSIDIIMNKVNQLIEYKKLNSNQDLQTKRNYLVEHKDIIGEFNYGIHSESNYVDIVDNLSEIVSIDNGKLVISGEKKVFENINIDASGNEWGNNYTSTAIDLNERILIHCTNFYPNDRTVKTLFDGKKEFTVPILVDGQEEQVTYRHHRNTTHHVINGTVGNTSDGNTWDNMKYIIFEPYMFHTDQIVNQSYSDTFTNGSINLSEKAILMVSYEAYKELTEEQKREYQIIIYTGDFRVAVQNLLVLDNQKLAKTDANDPSHSHSIYAAMETNLGYRDKCLNYVIGKVHDSITRFDISLEQLVKIIDIYIENFEKLINCCFIYKEQLIQDKILTFIYSSGFVKNKDGTFTILQEEEIRNRYLKDEALFHASISDIEMQEINEIKDIYLKYKQDKKEYNEMVDEAYHLNNILSTKINDITNLNDDKLREYLEYINQELQRRTPEGLKIRCTAKQIFIVYTNDEFEQIIEEHAEYNEILDGINIEFNGETKLIDNITNGIKIAEKIVDELEVMKNNRYKL